MSIFTANNSNNISNNNKESLMNNAYLANNLDVANPAPRCPVLLLLDTSGSMSGAPIDELNRALKQFIQETADDEAASRSVELEVVTFDDQANVAMPFCGIRDVDRNPEPLVTGGMTSMGAAMKLGLQHLKARRKLYKSSGISSYKPWVVLMTDGEPNDDHWEQPAGELRQLGERGKIQYIGVEIGDSANHELMQGIMPAQFGPVKLKGLRFKDFFRWLTDSLNSVSGSAVSDEKNLVFPGIDDWADL